MNKILVAAVGDQPEALYPAVKEFTFEHAHILTHPAYKKQSDQLKKDLEKFNIPYTEKNLSDNVWEDTFTQIAQFADKHPKREHIVVHAGIGDRAMQCAATSASFVNGLKAVNGNGKALFGLPILRFSYYSAINDRKRAILKQLEEGMKSMQAISEDMKISLSLLSYHIHGNRKSEGLIDMGLAELSEKNNQQYLALSAMGRLLLKGAIPEKEVTK
jgi:DNA-binding CsgD family transcriptional regulator